MKNFPLYFLFVIFFSPFLIFPIVKNYTNWLSDKTNQGEFLQPKIDVSNMKVRASDSSGLDLVSANTKDWLLVSVSGECGIAAKSREDLSLLSVVLGKNSERINMIALSREVCAKADYQLEQESELTKSGYYIIDANDEAVLYYPAYASLKSIKKDLGKLFKLKVFKRTKS